MIGAALVFQGCTVDLDAKSVMHQTYAAINYCSGFLMIAAALILDGLRSVTKNQ